MLKASFEPLDFSQRSVVAARRTEPRYLFEWHFHPEYEVSLIESGGGTCFIGHYVGEYRAGDVFLLGPDLPHTFVSGIGTPTTAHAAAYAQFSDRTLGDALLGLPEMADVSRLLTLASRGLQMRAGEEVTWLMGSLPGGRPVDRLVTLLRVLVELTRSNPSVLNGAPTAPMVDSDGRDRLETACRFVADHYEHGKVSRDAAARAVHLSPSAFSRFFTATMGRSFTRYVNEVRVGAACRLLATDAPVASIAANVGYESLANFNRQFRRLQGVSPSQYRHDQLLRRARPDTHHERARQMDQHARRVDQIEGTVSELR